MTGAKVAGCTTICFRERDQMSSKHSIAGLVEGNRQPLLMQNCFQQMTERLPSDFSERCKHLQLCSSCLASTAINRPQQLPGTDHIRALHKGKQHVLEEPGAPGSISKGALGALGEAMPGALHDTCTCQRSRRLCLKVIRAWPNEPG